MRDFDVIWNDEPDDERTFKACGETFTLRKDLRPEEFAELLAPIDAITGDPDGTALDVMVAMDNFVVGMLEQDGDAAQRWRDLRARTEGGLSSRHLQQIHRWIIEYQNGVIEEKTDHPTGSPRGSSGTPRKRGTRSTGSSSSPDLQVA